MSPEALLAHVAHRPWPLPRTPWVMSQRWSDLLFMHWAVPKAELRERVPSMLSLDTFEDQAWLAVAPFEINGLKLRGLPPFPGLSRFLELNVRTYVRVDDKPGVYFFSLDAASFMAVTGARAWYRLPYFGAHMTIQRHDARIVYSCRRTDSRAEPAQFEGEYGPAGPVTESDAGSLAYWLTERYCLYAVRDRRVYRADIHHLPWPLQPAVAVTKINTMAASHGIHLPDTPPLLHFARELDVLVWSPTLVETEI